MEYSTENRICQNCKQDFTIEPEDFWFYEKMKVPPPTFCFDCRLKRKLAYINERNLFKDTCDNCSKDIISMYSPESHSKVFCTDCYNNLEDCVTYGTEYDFSRNFFEQFAELFVKVPKLHLMHKNNNGEKCEYSNYTYRSRNVYLSYAVVKSEDIYYSKQISEGNKICLDCDTLHFNERGYELVGSSRNYNSRFLVRSSQCIDCAYLLNCVNCTNCCMSTNIKNKSYVFRNKQFSREEYMRIMKDFPLGSYKAQEELKREFYELTKHSICRFENSKKVENCTGDFMGYSKNTKYSFCNIDSENSKYIVFGTGRIRDSYDLVLAGRNELCYELAGGGSANDHTVLSVNVGTNHNVYYSHSLLNCTECFGCVRLVNKSYCILNKQYSKNEYKELLSKIIEHMKSMPYVDRNGKVYTYGEFSPIELSPFAYNESLAYEEFPMTRQEITQEGYIWREAEDKHYNATLPSSNLPDTIHDVTDTILDEIIACPNNGRSETKCTGAFRIMPDELRFYRLMNIPLPRACPNCRYYERKKYKNPWKLWHRDCMCDKDTHSHGAGKCEVEFETSYAPDRPEIIYCEKCYQAEVY